ncbi:hypothetical protein ACH33_04470 [Aneurinibacillus sp. XH2]|uniref:hypothetical protein n=1 Tax=Aneurinibacillus sp. XH2 TaxID=1450761 RepID=UPI00070FD385|nr:hypothetical protein [Aneurinibacillus sp. XH2]AMA72181.1 hypothetical protein ACH33_04470 [Aneurinibacillus sp. XH2]
MKKFIFVILLIILLLSACSKPPSPTPNSEHTSTIKNNFLYISPTDLFEGDAAKFQAFLGPLSGAVKIKYKGNKRKLKSTIELWENGKKTQTIGGEETDIFSKQGEFNGELAFSFQEETIEKTKPQYTVTSALIHEGGYSSSTFHLNKNAQHHIHGIVNLKQDLAIADNADVAVWGIQATDENSISTSSPEQALKTAKWLLIVKISLLD